MALPIISITGNLKRIEMKYTQSGKAVTKFQIECAEKNSKGEWTNLYLSGECWDKKAEFVNQYFQDGSLAIVTGKLFTNVYAKQDGTKVYENKLLFPDVTFAPKDKAGNQNQQQQSNQSPQAQANNEYQQSIQQPQQSKDNGLLPPEYEIDEDEIPF